MKRITAYLLLALFLVGCELLPVVPVETPADKMVTITALAGPNGIIDPSGITSIKLGDSITYLIKPNINYSTFSIKVDGMDQPINNTLKLKNVLYHRDIKVEFISTDVKMVTITALAGPNGIIDPSGITSIKLGDSITYLIKPNINYSTFSIKVDGMDQPINNILKLKNVLYHRDIKVEFISTKVLLLTEAPWMLKSLKVWQDGKEVADLILDEEQKAWSFYFTLGGKVGFCSSPGKCNDNEVYIFSSDENYLLIGWNKEPNHIVKLTKEEYIFTSPTTYNGKPALFEQTYYRP